MVAMSKIAPPAECQPSLADQIIEVAEIVLRSRTAAIRERFALAEIEYRIMTRLALVAPTSLSNLARAIQRDVAQVSRTLKALAERGMVSVERSPGRTSLLIDLTNEGRSIVTGMARDTGEWECALGSVIPVGENAQASACLSVIRQAAEALIHRTREQWKPVQ